MTNTEFLEQIKSAGAIIAPAVDARLIELTQNGLQQMRAAMMPTWMIGFFQIAGGAILGDAYIFGPAEIKQGTAYPVPSISELNREIHGVPQMIGRTVFGRNSLFWFAFDAFGNCYMLDNLSLNPLRKYEDPFQAMHDCLAVGKI
jgi:hypothetical protein